MISRSLVTRRKRKFKTRPAAKKCHESWSRQTSTEAKNVSSTANGVTSSLYPKHVRAVCLGKSNRARRLTNVLVWGLFFGSHDDSLTEGVIHAKLRFVFVYFTLQDSLLYQLKHFVGRFGRNKAPKFCFRRAFVIESARWRQWINNKLQWRTNYTEIVSDQTESAKSGVINSAPLVADVKLLLRCTFSILKHWVTAAREKSIRSFIFNLWKAQGA